MKRFIAGAQCPTCKSTDTLFVETKTGNNVVQCTRCAYHDVRASSLEQPETEEKGKPVIWH